MKIKFIVKFNVDNVLWKELERDRIPLLKERIYLSPVYPNLTFEVDDIFTKLYNDDIIVCGDINFNLPGNGVKFFIEKEGWTKR